MTPRNWGVGGWLVASAVLLVAAGAGAGLLVWDRQYFLLALAVGTSHYLAYKLPNRNLIAELEAARARKDTAIEAGMGVAFQVQELERRISGEHEAIEVEPFMADSGYRAPGLVELYPGSWRCSLVPQNPWPMATNGTGYRLALTDETCFDIEVKDTETLDFGQVIWGDVIDAPGHLLPGDVVKVTVDVDAYEAVFELLNGRSLATGGVVPRDRFYLVGEDGPVDVTPFEANSEVEHLGQACEYSIRSDEDCGQPAERWVKVAGAPWFLCRTHYDVVIERGETDIDPCETCGDSGMVPVTGNGSDGFDRCPDCQPERERCGDISPVTGASCQHPPGHTIRHVGPLGEGAYRERWDITPDPLACVYDRNDTAKVERIADGAAKCACPDCWAWLRTNGYLPDLDASDGPRSLPRGRID